MCRAWRAQLLTLQRRYTSGFVVEWFDCTQAGKRRLWYWRQGRYLADGGFREMEGGAAREKIWLNIFRIAHVGICSRDMAEQ